MKNGLILSLGVMTGLVTAFDGGMILANQMVGDKQYSEAEFQEYGEQQREEGYNEGLTVNVGYSEEDLQNAYNKGKAEMEEILSVVGNKNIIFDNGQIELFTDGNGMIDGMFMHNYETNKYSKIISSGTDFDVQQYQYGNELIIYGINNSEGCYFIDLTTGEFNTIEEEGQWEIKQIEFNYKDDGVLLYASKDMIGDKENTAKGVKCFKFYDLAMTEIMSDGQAWMVQEKGINSYYISSATNDVLGLYDLTFSQSGTVHNYFEITPISTEGYGFDYNTYHEIGVGDVKKKYISCVDGFTQINEDKTLTIILPTENGEIWQFDGNAVYNSTTMYTYIAGEELKEVDFGVEPIQVVNLGRIFTVYNNEEKLVVISTAYQVFTISTPGENIRLEEVLLRDDSYKDWLVHDTRGVLYRLNYFDYELETIKEFGNVKMESILNGGINGEDFMFLNVFNYDDGFQDLYGYKNGELTLFAEDCFSIYCEDTNDTTGTFVCQTSDGEERITIDYATFTIVE